MKLVGIMPCRNEDWCIGLTARAALAWCDHLIVLDHCSEDETLEVLSEIAAENPGRMTVLYESDQQWEEMRHRQRLLDEARRIGATHIAMVDADEILTGDLLPTIRGIYDTIPMGATLQLPWLCLRWSPDTVMVTGVWGQAVASCGIRNERQWRWEARNGYDFHHRHPMGGALVPFQPMARTSGLMHLQFLSKRRLLAKQALYKATEVVRWPGRDTLAEINKRYDYAVYDTERARTMPTPIGWWAPYIGLLRDLKSYAEPWQEAELARLVAEHGKDKFAGLDLFGVVK